MSVRVESPPAPSAVASDRASLVASRTSTRGPWGRLAVVVAILAASGAARLWQEHRVEKTLEAGRVSSFALAEIPLTIGDWKGKSTKLDPRIVRGSGSTDLITRRYVNQKTGVGIDVVICFGPTSDMFIHTPELCYPSAGFAPAAPADERKVAVPGHTSVPFRALVFTKGDGGLADTQEVYYSLWYDGRWTTASSSPKASQRIPGMYKVQVSRPVIAHERRDIDNPCESLLSPLLAEIEALRGGKVKPTEPTETRRFSRR